MGDIEKEVYGEDSSKQALLERGEISLLLNTYDDIFSDFDPRPFSHRSLSDDFLVAMKKATLDQGDSLELRFLIPKTQKKPEHEILIKKRLREHFRRHALILENDVMKMKTRGRFMAILGIILIMAASFIAQYVHEGFLTTFLLVLLEPAGWFTVWTGLDQLYKISSEHNYDLDFYRKMIYSEITFMTY